MDSGKQNTGGCKRLARWALAALVAAGAWLGSAALADPFPPVWGTGTIDEANGPIHFAPAPWPSEPPDPVNCTTDCGDWQPYSRFQSDINDPRVQDPSNGGTAPQNYVNVSSSCIDKTYPSIYYYLHKGAAPDGSQDVIMFRWRVEQIAHNYATGPSAGNYGATDPWSSGLWTVLFDVDGDGYRDIAAHLNGSSGDPSHPIDMIAGIWGNIPTQSIDYLNDPNIKLIAHNPTAFTSGSRLLNFHDSLSPDTTWPAGSATNTWDYGTTRAKLVYTNSCNEYFVDYQIPVRMLDASSSGPNPTLNGPKITRSTPISMLFCTANSLNNPFQKDCSLNRTYIGDAGKPGPFGDYVSFDQDEPYSQPIISKVTAVAPASNACGSGYTLEAIVQDTLAVTNGVVHASVKAVSFWYYHDADGDGVSNDGGNWIHAADASLVSGTLNKWRATWDSSSLPKGRYLVGVQAVDDKTLHDDDVSDAPRDNRTFSYVTSNDLGQVYINGAWATGQDANGNTIDFPAQFPTHTPGMTPGTTEDWYGNPAITGIQVATAGVDLAINSCGVAPTLQKSVDKSEVGPGETVTFTLTVSNAGSPGVFTVNKLVDVLPDGFTYVPGSTSGDFGSTDPSSSGQTLTWDFSPGVGWVGDGSASLSFQAAASTTAGSYNNVARGETSFGTLESEPVSVAVGAARLTLSKTPGSYSTTPGGQVSYTLAYTNPTSVTISNTVLTDVLPANTTLHSCTPSCSSGGGSVSWNLGDLAGGASGSVTLVLDVAPAYPSNSLLNTASLSGKDPGGNDVTASAQSTIYVNVPIGSIPAFTLEKTANAVRIAPGATVQYTLSYHNYGGAAASSVVITDTLPAGMTYVNASCSGGDSCSHNAGVVTWNFASIAAGASGSVTFSATAANPFQAANPAENTASITWTGGGPVEANHLLGVTGTSCSTNYFSDSQENVGAAGSRYVTTTTAPVGVGTNMPATAVTVALPQNTVTEIARFYGPVSSYLDFSSGSSTVAGQINYVKTSNGNLTVLVSTYDYDPATGTETLLGSATYPDVGSASPPVSLTAGTLTGALQKGHRLLWIVSARNDTTNKTPGLQVVVNTSGTYAQVCSPPPANLTLEKTVDQATVTEGQTTAITYTLHYANTGSVNATNAFIVDTLPAGVSFDSATLGGNPITPTGSNPYTFNLGTVAAGATGTLVIQATVSDTATGLLTNTAGIESDQTARVEDTASTLVGMPGDSSGPTAPVLSMMKSASKTQLGANDSVTYTVTVVNTGTADATNVTVTDDYPDWPYFTYDSCFTLQGNCGGANVLTWNLGTLAPGASATLTYTMLTSGSLPDGLTELNNTAFAADDNYCIDPKPASCTSDPVTVYLNGSPALSLDKTASPETDLKPGDVVTYTLKLANNGSATATGVTVRDPIPAGSAYVAVSLVGDAEPGVGVWDPIGLTDGSGDDAAQFDAVNNQAVFTLGSVAAGEEYTLSFQVRVGTPAAGVTAISITNTASASAANAATVQDSATVTGSATPALALSKTGPAQAPYPAALLTADVSAAASVPVNTTQLLNEGQVVSINGTARAILARTANSLELDGNVTATSGASVIPAITYLLSYQNTGTGIAPAAQLVDTLPAGSVFVSASNGGTENSGSVTWSLGDLAPGAAGTVSVTVIPGGTGTLTNTATLSCTGCTDATDDAETRVGGLVVSKTTSTPLVAASTGVPLNIASYTITVANSTGSAIHGVLVKDLLSSGFTYKTGTTQVDDSASGSSTTDPAYEQDGSSNDDPGRPIWTVDVPANGWVTIRFDAEIAESVGPATYQNEVELTKPGVGIVPFDALSTPQEDVTVVGTDKGRVEGYVFRDDGATQGSLDSGDTRYAGVPVVLSRNGATCWPLDATNAYSGDCYVTYTDGSGYFSLLVPTGNWTVDVIETQGVPGGLNIAVGTDTTDITVAPQATAQDINGYDEPPTSAPDVYTTVDAPASVAAGDPVTTLITFGNQGDETAEGVTYTVTLSTGLTGVSCQGATCDYDPATGVLTLTGLPETLVPGQTAPVVVTYTAPGSGPLDVTSEIATTTANDPTPNNTANDSTLVTTSVVDVAAWLSAPATATVGSTVNVPVSFTNLGGVTATGVVYGLLLPSGISGVTCSGSGITCTNDNGLITITGLPTSLAPGQTVGLVLGYTAPGSGPVQVTANTNATNDANPANNTAIGSTGITPAGTPDPDVLSTVAPPAGAAPGSTVTVPVSYRNLGPDPATVTLYEVVLGGAAAGNVEIRNNGALCTYDSGTGAITGCGLPSTLNPGQAVDLVLTYTAPASGTVTVDADITVSESETNIANNPSSGATTVNSADVPDVYTTVDVPATVPPGETVHALVGFGNQGLVPADGVSYSITLPPGLSDVACSGAACVYDPATGVMTVSGLPASLSVGQTAQVLVSYTAPASGPLVVSSAIGTTTPGEAPTNNNQASASTTVQAGQAADVTTWVTAPASASLGSTVLVNVGYTNLGALDATTVTYSLTGLPVGASVSYNGVPCTYAGDAVTGCNLPATLTPGQVVQLVASYTATSLGSLTVTSTVGAGNDSDPGNNTDSATTLVESDSPADVTTTVSPPASAAAGSLVAVPLSFSNLGPSIADNLGYDLDLSGTAVTNVAIRHNGVLCTYDSGTGAITGCGLPSSLNPGEAVNLVLTYTAPASGSTTVTTHVTTSTGESNSGNNSASGSTTFIAAAPSATGGISGTVWYDMNGDDQIDGGESRRAGWGVELLLEGAGGAQVIGQTTTNASGGYQFTGLAPGLYTVRFINPNGQLLTSGRMPVNGDATNGGVPSISQLTGITVAGGSTVVNQNLPIDPSGVVYNSVTRTAISGALVTLVGPPGFDPALHVVGGSASVTTGADGAYAFLLLPTAPDTGNYYLTVTGPVGYTFQSALIPPSVDPWPAGGASPGTVGPPPQGSPLTTYYLFGPKLTGDLTLNNIPLDPVASHNGTPIPVPATGWPALALLSLMLGLLARRGRPGGRG